MRKFKMFAYFVCVCLAFALGFYTRPRIDDFLKVHEQPEKPIHIEPYPPMAKPVESCQSLDDSGQTVTIRIKI